MRDYSTWGLCWVPVFMEAAGYPVQVLGAAFRAERFSCKVIWPCLEAQKWLPSIQKIWPRLAHTSPSNCRYGIMRRYMVFRSVHSVMSAGSMNNILHDLAYAVLPWFPSGFRVWGFRVYVWEDDAEAQCFQGLRFPICSFFL